jgi:hypothetical protein
MITGYVGLSWKKRARRKRHNEMNYSMERGNNMPLAWCESTTCGGGIGKEFSMSMSKGSCGLHPMCGARDPLAPSMMILRGPSVHAYPINDRRIRQPGYRPAREGAEMVRPPLFIRRRI